MRVLLIKTSSMGDVIHTLPALTDAANALPGIQFDWVVEKSFSDIPWWHPSVTRVIPVSLRRWRKNLFAAKTREEWRHFRQQLEVHEYDVIIDAQGLVKSAFLTFFAKGTRAGLDFSSARESLASFAYQKKAKVDFKQHAIARARQLLSQVLGYPLPDTSPDYGIDNSHFIRSDLTHEQSKDIIFLHSTTWDTKLWPERYWKELASIVIAAGYTVKIGGGSREELARAERIAKSIPGVVLLPRLEIPAMAELLVNAKAAVAVDTGFGHLAAALNIPTLSIYGATNPLYTGALGKHSIHLTPNFPCAPCLSRDCRYRKKSAAPTSVVWPACYSTITPQRVWHELGQILG